MEKTTLSVVIVSYENVNVLKDCLDSIQKYNDIGQELEVIIVDNSESDVVYNYVVKNYRNIRIFKHENNGFGAANNFGAMISRGKYLLFLNPDTILVEPLFKFAIERFEEDETLSLFGVELVDANLRKTLSFGMIDNDTLVGMVMIRIFNLLNVFVDGKMFISGADMFVRKEDFLRAGMFDENIFMYMEEADLTKRIKAIGGKVRYFNDKRLIHLGGGSSGNVERATKARMLSTRYYCEKYDLDFSKVFRRKLRYERVKLFFCTLLRDERADKFRQSIEIMKIFYRDSKSEL